jgi:hypothetical protein
LRQTLFDLYHIVVEEHLSDTSYWYNRTPVEIERLANETEIVDIEVEDLEFNGGDGVTFDATLRFRVNGSSHNGPGDFLSISDQFTYAAAGYLEGSNPVIDAITFRY